MTTYKQFSCVVYCISIKVEKGWGIHTRYFGVNYQAPLFLIDFEGVTVKGVLVTLDLCETCQDGENLVGHIIADVSSLDGNFEGGYLYRYRACT